ncbi:DUF3450 domain-containing protein [Alteromonas sp. ASW11-36]|uniref:DUF3450 domain-containing protein n=1 Tax=Alteromonas arenosi TaxID=3055817 RepID=A0ABT7SW81_9ALTE|nr:DUF3450 domain-containing protein [Alteromonas sp. ASW11-36]MDM7859829.1 DUF3450 domain-containing protein [Alteromonas sp. ASW11-36]
MRRSGLLILGLCLTYATHAYSQEQTEALVEQGLQRLEQNREAQAEVDKENEAARVLEKQYIEQLKIVDGLNMYNAMLQRQLNDQQTEIDKLDFSISNATQIERQIMPLLVRMVDALENFVRLDFPFLTQEREERIHGLRILLEKSEFSTSEKCRRVFEAYQIENEYGYTIESYKGRVQLEEQQFAVDFLRIGRIALLYRDLAGEKVGMWDPVAKQWLALTERQFLRHVTKGLKIAREEISPELITIPLYSTLEVR